MKRLRVGLSCLLLGASFAWAAQESIDAPIPHASGQSVSPVYEGWYENSDGSFTLSFGYFTRNKEEILEEVFRETIRGE